ncbi:MAG: tetratricopeptide repeat protein [Lentisphaerae bacterium]|nr:tetratricopeptide repeat protein [Lentisphaerota bacterium]
MRSIAGGRRLAHFLPWLPSVMAVALRLACLNELISSPFFSPLGGDRGLYHSVASRLASGQNVESVFTFMPLYPYLLAGLYKLLGGANLAAAAIFQALLDGLTARLIFGLTQRRYGQAAAIIAASGFALLGPAATYSLVTMPVALGLFWTALAATCLDRWREQWTWITAGATGLILGVGGQILGFFWLAIPIVALWIVLSPMDRSLIPPSAICRSTSVVRRPCFAKASQGRPSSVFRRLLQAALVLGLGYACLLPSLIHNFRVSGEWIPVSAHTGLNLYMGNNPASKGYGTALPGIRLSAEEMTRDAARLTSRAIGRPLTLAQADRFWQDRARRFWREHPAQALQLLARKVQRLLSIREFDDTGLCRLLPAAVPSLKLAQVSFGLIWLLACAGYGFRQCTRSSPGSWIITLCCAAGVLITFVTTRYRLPLAVLLLPAAGGTLAALPGLFHIPIHRDWRHLLIGWGGALLAVLPHALPDTTLADALNQSAYWQRQGDSDKALAYAQQARDLQPDSAEASFALGNAFFLEKKYAAALDAFQHALAIQPERTDALFNAGITLECLNRKTEAQALYEQVIALDKRHAQAWFALAILRQAQGQTEKAQQALAAAAALVGWDHPAIVKFQAEIRNP